MMHHSDPNHWRPERPAGIEESVRQLWKSAKSLEKFALWAWSANAIWDMYCIVTTSETWLVLLSFGILIFSIQQLFSAFREADGWYAKVDFYRKEFDLPPME